MEGSQPFQEIAKIIDEEPEINNAAAGIRQWVSVGAVLQAGSPVEPNLLQSRFRRDQDGLNKS